MQKRKKLESLQTLLQKNLKDLDTPLCPKVEEISPPIKYFNCAQHSFNLPEKQKKKHCAEKAKLFLLAKIDHQ